MATPTFCLFLCLLAVAKANNTGNHGHHNGATTPATAAPTGVPEPLAGQNCYDCHGPHSPDFINCVQHPTTCEHNKICQIIRTPDNSNTGIQCASPSECSHTHHLPACGTGAITVECHTCCDNNMPCVQQAIADLLPSGTTAPTQAGTTGTQPVTSASTQAPVTATTQAAVTATTQAPVTATTQAAVTATTQAAVTATTQAAVTATTQAAVTATTGTNAPTQAPLTDTTQTAITSVPMRALSCVQCGDYDMRTPCTDSELLLDTVTFCADTTASRCMTDVFTDASAVVTTYKRCVHDTPCEQLWYSQTSDKTECLNFDPTGSIADLTCHFCCVGNGCNVNIVPDYSTQWRP